MISSTWITSTETSLAMIPLTGCGIYLALLLLTRLTGLRSFSKMSSFDFAITVAIGSVIASTLLARNPPLLAGVEGLAVLYGIQFLVSLLRRHTRWAEVIVDNKPLLIMAGARVLHDHLDKARMTEEDLKSKLRLAGVTHGEQLFAVILETTGDVSILRSGKRVDPDLFSEVRGKELLQGDLHLPEKPRAAPVARRMHGTRD